jgi:hypothetical protein
MSVGGDVPGDDRIWLTLVFMEVVACGHGHSLVKRSNTPSGLPPLPNFVQGSPQEQYVAFFFFFFCFSVFLSIVL